MRLGARQPDGATLRQHLQAEARATGQPDPMLQAQVPAGGQALWQAFAELSAARPAGMGPSAIPHVYIEGWQRLSRVRLSPWEVDTLVAMDHAALEAMAPPPKAQPTGGKHP